MKNKVSFVGRKSKSYLSDDYLFWQSKTPEERVEAVEILRQQWYQIRNERPKRLRRVFRIIKPA